MARTFALVLEVLDKELFGSLCVCVCVGGTCFKKLISVFKTDYFGSFQKCSKCQNPSRGCIQWFLTRFS
jgi:hypothetical protein